MTVALDYQNNLFDSQVVTENGTGHDDLVTLTGAESIDNFTIRFSNYSAGIAKANAWCQSSAGGEADADKFLDEYSIPANDYRDVDVPRMTGGGNQAMLTVSADTATSLTVSQISGIKRS